MLTEFTEFFCFILFFIVLYWLLQLSLIYSIKLELLQVGQKVLLNYFLIFLFVFQWLSIYFLNLRYKYQVECIDNRMHAKCIDNRMYAKFIQLYCKAARLAYRDLIMMLKIVDRKMISTWNLYKLFGAITH